MRHALAIMTIISLALFAEEQKAKTQETLKSEVQKTQKSEEPQLKLVECANSPAGALLFAEKLPDSDVRLVRLEWEEYLGKYEYSYIRRLYGWARVKTSKYAKADGGSHSSGGIASFPLTDYPFRRIKGDTYIVVNPTISKEAHRK